MRTLTNCDQSDILHRHQQSHVTIGRETLPEGASSRACLACAAARIRCSRKTPCSRCTKKGVNCIYPMAQKTSGGVLQSWQGVVHSPVNNVTSMGGTIEQYRDQGISEAGANRSLADPTSRFPLPGTVSDFQNNDLGHPPASA